MTLLKLLFMLVLFSYAVRSDSRIQSSRCLRSEETPFWKRASHYKSVPFNLTLVATDDPFHWILNYIFGIIVHERFGYQYVTFSKDNRPFNELFTCQDARCNDGPAVHVNLEAWLPVGTTAALKISHPSIVDHGPLGPLTHWAFLSRLSLVTSTQQNVSLCDSLPDHAYRETHGLWLDTSIDGQLCSRIERCNISKCQLVSPSAEGFAAGLVFSSWYKNGDNTTFSDCHRDRCRCICGMGFQDWVPKNRLDPTPHMCFKSYQATKLSWAELSTLMPLVHQLLNSLHISQSDFNQLINVVYSLRSTNTSEAFRREQYYNIACEWVRRSRNRWKAWTVGWNRKENLTVIGLFTLYGKWNTDLHKIAIQAVDFVNQASDYFGNTEYAITLDVRNLTCAQDVVVNDYFNLLLRSPRVTRIGVIAALCSDSIEPVVKVANHRRQVIISPTVESARIMEKLNYPYFFRTVPSMLSVNMALIRIFHHWGWRRIGVFRKDDFIFDPRLFQFNQIEIIVDVELKENLLTYDFVIQNLKKMVGLNTRIFVIEHFAQGSAMVLCAAYHLNLFFDSGYVWFINSWLSHGWWKPIHVIPKQCTYDQMANITSMLFTITHQIFKPPIFNEHLQNAYPTDHAGTRYYKPSNTSKRLVLLPPKNSTTFNDYQFYTFESVIVLATALLRLLSDYPSALSNFDSPEVAMLYRNLVANTNFASTHETFKRVINSSLFNTLLPTQPTVLPDSYTSSDLSTVSHSVFSELNERIPDYWLLLQHQTNHTALIAMIFTKSSIPASFFVLQNNSSFPSSVDFNNYVTESWLTEVDWGRNGGVPSDGSILSESCVFFWLMRLLSVNCLTAKVIFSLSIVFLCAVFLVLGLLKHHLGKIRETQRRIRQPYEDLRTELADIDISCTDIVLNRRVGQGAFGMVFGGEAKRKGVWESVAVKVIGGKATYESKRDFLAEAKLMRELDHKNIVRLIGVCLRPRENHLYLIMENMLLGDLKTYLLPRRVLAQQSPDHEDVRPETLTKMALDIAEGLAYLHSKYLVHRDIACRNCLVGSDRTVKIGDFGLTRKFTTSETEGYYRFTRNRELPIRWMSPEAVQFGVFSVHSDLWSYGIVLYEIITFGVLPYDGLGDVEVVERVKQINFSILDFLPPAAINTIVAGLIDQCCQHQWQHRPVSLQPVIRRLKENPGCVRPFLTEEPPKLNKAIDALPFQPGAGACIMSENVLAGRTSTNPMLTADSISGPHSATVLGIGFTRSFHSAAGNLIGVGHRSLTHRSSEYFSDATAAAMRVVANETNARRRHKTADPVLGGEGEVLRRTATSSGGILGSSTTGNSSQLSFEAIKGNLAANTTTEMFPLPGLVQLPTEAALNKPKDSCPRVMKSSSSNWFSVRHAAPSSCRLIGNVASSPLPIFSSNSNKPTPELCGRDKVMGNTATDYLRGTLSSGIRSMSAECLLPFRSPRAPCFSVKSAPEGHLSSYFVDHTGNHILRQTNANYGLVFGRGKRTYPQAKSRCCSNSYGTTFCPSVVPRSYVENASNLLRSMFRVLTRSHKTPAASQTSIPMRMSKSSTSCRTVPFGHNCEEAHANEPLLGYFHPLVSTSCPPMLSTEIFLPESPNACSDDHFSFADERVETAVNTPDPDPISRSNRSSYLSTNRSDDIAKYSPSNFVTSQQPATPETNEDTSSRFHIV